MKKKYNNKTKNKRTEEIYNDVIQKLQKIIDNGEYEKFLKFKNKLKKNYSFNNLILIFSQFPDATYVAGKKEWLKLGRETIENAQKIRIVAPIPRNYKKKIKKIVDGKEIEEIKTYNYNLYKYITIYDISQTKGEPIPLQYKEINNDDMAYLYEKLKKFSHIPIYEKELQGGLKGYYSEKYKEIIIKNTLSSNDKALVLIHELTHSLYDDFDYSKDRNLSEVFVQSVTYIVANHFELNSSCGSFNYIIKYAKGDTKVVIDLGNKIIKCANDFIDKLEKFDMQETQIAA